MEALDTKCVWVHSVLCVLLFAAPVIVTQEIPGQGYSPPVAVHVPDAQQYNHWGFAQLSANPTIPAPVGANDKKEPVKN